MSIDEVSLKEFLLAVIDGHARQTETKFDAIQEALLKKENADKEKFASVNEFRGQAADVNATFARKAEMDIRFKSLEERLEAAVSQLQLSKGQEKGSSITWGIVATVVGVAIGLLAIFVKWISK